MYEWLLSVLCGPVVHVCFTDSQVVSFLDDYSESHQGQYMIVLYIPVSWSPHIYRYLVAILTSLCPLRLRGGSLPKNDPTAIPALPFSKGSFGLSGHSPCRYHFSGPQTDQPTYANAVQTCILSSCAQYAQPWSSQLYRGPPTQHEHSVDAESLFR